MANSYSNKTHVLRIMNDLREFYKEKVDDIYIVPEEDHITFIHALIIGPRGTPYENGFFYYFLKFPDDYPLKPPEVKLRTTLGNTVRFNPNLYANGKVCLSILGTWTGPSWLPSLTILKTLQSIQYIMNDHPYHNEPGFEKDATSEKRSDVQKNVEDYNDMITHETLRVAVIEILHEHSIDAGGMPTALKEIMISHFITNYQFYENLIKSKLEYDGLPIRDPHRDPLRPQKFGYKKMLDEIINLKGKVSHTESTDSPIYKKIAEKTIMTCRMDVLEPVSESTDESDDLVDFYSEEVDVEEMLYEPESETEES